jgi:hypothetical protein
MKYKVKANLVPDRAAAFFKVLTDGTVQNQKPDGAAIVSAMKDARITSPNAIEWFETCYCESPLKHERETVYDKYLTNISTEVVDQFGGIDGESFWDYLLASGSQK